MMRETPQVTPALNQLVMMCRVTPLASRRSPSVLVMLREKDSSVRRWRMISQSKAMGVRE